MKNLQSYEEFLNESSSLDYTYIPDSGDGKPTFILKLNPIAWERVKHLFDKSGRPINKEIMGIPDNEGFKWSLYSQEIKSIGGDSAYKIYGVSGDATFGNAPTYYPQKSRGNKKIAKKIFDWFIDKYL